MKQNSEQKVEITNVSPTCGKPTVMGSTASIGEIEGINRVHHLNFLNNTLPDKCANLIIADPPYFEVKGAFDFVWEDMKAYLQDVEKWAKECKRLLADNGTLFWFGSARNIAYSQVIFDEYFELENNIAIEFNRQTKKGVELFRCFAPVSERLLMYSNEIEMTGLQYIDENFVKPNNPFKDIIKDARKKAGLSTIQVAETGKWYGKVNHGGSVANWENGDNIPTIEQWQKLSTIIPLAEDYEAVKELYESVRMEYELLRIEHESKRRHFNNFMKLYDIMKFDQEAHITKNYEHDTCKPETLTRALIMTCSRKDDLVIVPFAGSGTECAMSVKEGRRAIGFDIEEKYCKMSNRRVQDILRKPELFQ